MILTALAFLYTELSHRDFELTEVAEMIHTKAVLGPLIFIVYIVLSVVIAPISMIPLLPLGNTVWGWLWLSVYLFIAWHIGAIIAFFISRKFGRQVVGKFVNLKKIKASLCAR